MLQGNHDDDLRADIIERVLTTEELGMVYPSADESSFRCTHVLYLHNLLNGTLDHDWLGLVGHEVLNSD